MRSGPDSDYCCPPGQPVTATADAIVFKAPMAPSSHSAGCGEANEPSGHVQVVPGEIADGDGARGMGVQRCPAALVSVREREHEWRVADAPRPSVQRRRCVLAVPAEYVRHRHDEFVVPVATPVLDAFSYARPVRSTRAASGGGAPARASGAPRRPAALRRREDAGAAVTSAPPSRRPGDERVGHRPLRAPHVDEGGRARRPRRR